MKLIKVCGEWINPDHIITLYTADDGTKRIYLIDESHIDDKAEEYESIDDLALKINELAHE